MFLDKCSFRWCYAASSLNIVLASKSSTSNASYMLSKNFTRRTWSSGVDCWRRSKRYGFKCNCHRKIVYKIFTKFYVRDLIELLISLYYGWNYPSLSSLFRLALLVNQWIYIYTNDQYPWIADNTTKCFVYHDFIFVISFEKRRTVLIDEYFTYSNTQNLLFFLCLHFGRYKIYI